MRPDGAVPTSRPTGWMHLRLDPLSACNAATVKRMCWALNPPTSSGDRSRNAVDRSCSRPWLFGRHGSAAFRGLVGGALEWAARARRVVLVTWFGRGQSGEQGSMGFVEQPLHQPVRGQWLGMPRRTPRAWRVRSAVRWMSWRRSVDLRVRA